MVLNLREEPFPIPAPLRPPSDFDGSLPEYANEIRVWSDPVIAAPPVVATRDNLGSLRQQESWLELVLGDGRSLWYDSREDKSQWDKPAALMTARQVRHLTP